MTQAESVLTNNSDLSFDGVGCEQRPKSIFGLMAL
jgi:hypothetical protein